MSENKFLPICKKDMEERGWEQLDFNVFDGILWADSLFTCVCRVCISAV